ncbi:hypothetical protein [Salimicrobium salexigens]|uniref:CNNM transmembrane domain-containing protein n=1 Tax=Salimicrobium salexigens TaxID=908941 RepID=A0ABY1KNP5_9BACI|nr:hypothetical protein [Salimicrobium salexigens]SIS54082.1 hypothetical protein SAMN05421758_102253 [Salimicrobium salexigens]
MNSKLKRSLSFSFTIAVITFVLAAIFSIISSSLLNGVPWIAGMVVVFVIVLTGVFFDMLGIAATAGREAPFHSMASEKVFGAKHAVAIVRNADRFATFCNDVIGDIAGIISGTASALVVLQLAIAFGNGEGSTLQLVLSVIMTSTIAALTVGGKAVGKYLAINHSTAIIFFTARLIARFEKYSKWKIVTK